MGAGAAEIDQGLAHRGDSIDFSLHQIDDVHQGRSRFDACVGSGRTGLVHPRQVLGKSRWQALMSHLLKALAVIGHQITKGGVAQPHRLVEHRPEHRHEVAIG